MMLHTIVVPSNQELADRGIKMTMTRARFALFMMNEIFPGGRLPTVAIVEDHATRGGFEITRVQPLRLHYARTLDFWAEALENRKEDAIAIQSEEVYNRYMKYLTGCAELFREGACDVAQFTLVKPAA
jgi:cyclopropane-fatty-acyl-phospholipid synthase